jgi:enhancing lycopene biosynthesis protein 2
MARVAVVLAGCGRADGSEIHEAVSCLIHLARLGVECACFAPDVPQADVVNHVTGQPMPEKRNVLVESGRIARGDIRPLSALEHSEFDAAVFPGGFGAAKNLCTFARDHENCTVLPDVERTVRAFHGAGKPVAMCCIAPVIGARVLGTARNGPGVRVTVGNDPDVGAAIGKMGATNVSKSVTEIEVDETQRVVTTPAYMHGDATPWEVFRGIGPMIEQILAMVKLTPRAPRPAGQTV